jgi:hypothetical protein
VTTSYPSHATLSHIDAVAHELINERVRQIAEEDYTPHEDDSRWSMGQLAKAAACYVLHATRSELSREMERGQKPRSWPWDLGWWKPKDRRRDLVRAGALIIAEIERLDRAASRTKTG